MKKVKLNIFVIKFIFVHIMSYCNHKIVFLTLMYKLTYFLLSDTLNSWWLVLLYIYSALDQWPCTCQWYKYLYVQNGNKEPPRILIFWHWYTACFCVIMLTCITIKSSSFSDLLYILWNCDSSCIWNENIVQH